MTQQFSLPGIPARQPRIDRLFYGIFPDAVSANAAQSRQRHLCTRYRLKGKPIAPERFHVTLHLVGDYAGLPPAVVRSAQEAAATVIAHPFEVVFDRTGSFAGNPDNVPIVLLGSGGNDALRNFQRVLGDALKKAGLKIQSSSQFTPHLTLLRANQPIPEEAMDPVGWMVHEFVLVHSLLGDGQYIILGRWPLRG